MINFGNDRESALNDIRRLSTALDQPIGMYQHNGVWYGEPAGNLLDKDLDSLQDFQIVKPKEAEVK